MPFSAPEAGSQAEGMKSRSLEVSIQNQIDAGAARIRHKLGSSPEVYIAYFQSYTNTYAPAPYLEQLFSQAISHADIVALSIATRPDCLPPDVLALLGRLNHIKPVWVELGLQTMHPRTAEYIRRGYATDCYIQAVKNLKMAGISHIITHVILGLPGESTDGPKRLLIAPAWSGNKKRVLNTIMKGMEERDVRQGNIFPDYQTSPPWK